MIRRPPRSTLTDTLFPYTTLFRSGVHSGDASGVVPSSFRILRALLSRLEDEATGRIQLDALHVDVPADRLQQATVSAQVLGTAVYDKFPLLPGMQPMADDLTELVRSEERRVGKECVSPCRSRWSPYH